MTPAYHPHIHSNEQHGNLLNVNDELFHMILQCKDYSMMIIDPFGVVLNLNSGTEIMYGHPSDEIIGNNISMFYLDEEKKNNQPLKHLKCASKHIRYELEGWRFKKNRSLFYASTILTALYTIDGTLKGFSQVTRDVTYTSIPKENA